MNRTIVAAIAAVSLFAVTACNQEGAAPDTTETAGVAALAGTWKVDLGSSQFEDAPDVYLIKDGQYSCSSCSPPLASPADGKFHPVADRPYYDQLSVTVVDDRSISFARRKGDTDVGNSTWRLSDDGNTLNVEFVDKTTNPAVSGKGTSTRVAAAPAGAHPVSGSWKANRLDSISDEALTVTFAVDGDILKSRAGDGTGYEAKVGGPDVPVAGDPSGLVVAVTQPSPNSWVETYKRNGKIVGIATMTLGADGKLSGVYENKISGSTNRWTALKQS